ncbi:DNA cytosine methyltransferase [Paraburkholderia sp. BL21I4N1]|uniref:DNA cytosine methyltransferase n=1 Tax=Paraburkholderia sp. BL21I4N1 TaxID=1938801 RepID=UPI002158495C|nr:DNA cytosine methyltransferase [Paraburkholderia sp. BL21I4N1]
MPRTTPPITDRGNLPKLAPEGGHSGLQFHEGFFTPTNPQIVSTYNKGISRRPGSRNPHFFHTFQATISSTCNSDVLPYQGESLRPRRLTPRECARLMGFPDTFRIPVSDTQAYRQFGNSVVMREVARIMLPHVQILLAEETPLGSKQALLYA